MPNSYINLLNVSWKNARHRRPICVIVYSLFAIAAGINALTPLAYGWFINSLQKHPQDAVATTLLYATVYLAIFICHWAFHGPTRIMETKLASEISKNFMDEHYKILLEMPLGWHKEHLSGVIISKIQKGYTALRGFFANGFTYLQTLIHFAISFLAMLYFSPFYGMVALLIGFITIGIILSFDKKYIQSLLNINKTNNDIFGNLNDSLHNINSVITLRLEKTVHKTLLDKFINISKLFVKSAIINECKWFTASFMICLIYCIIVIGYVYQNYTSPTIDLGHLVALIGFVTQFTITFYNVAAQYSEIIQYDTDIQACNEFISEHATYARQSANSTIGTNWKEIIIENLNFSYNSIRKQKTRSHLVSEDVILSGISNISIKINKGQRIALVGESGHGKSTCLALLRGLYTPINGFKLTVDGKTEAWHNLSNATTLIPQEVELFKDSILYNLTMGLPFSADLIRQACDIASFSEVVNQMKDSYQEKIEEKGANLSGGQKQRLALARGILFSHLSPILILDEPTSSVDTKTEQIIFKNLFDSFSDKTIICSIHNLDLLNKFDYVYFFKDGKIVEERTIASTI
jgi:ATP-binding cassette subfamily B protein